MQPSWYPQTLLFTSKSHTMSWHWAGDMDLSQSPPAMAQRIHRQLRQITGVDDPYRHAKDRLNNLVMELIPALKAEMESGNDPLLMASRRDWSIRKLERTSNHYGRLAVLRKL